MTSGNKTLKFYDENAYAYALRQPGKRHLEMREKFIAMLPPQALVLDLGCGAGHDAQAFLKANLRVDLVDFSQSLAKECERRTNRPVRIERIEKLNENCTFDALWASASLLHLNVDVLEDVFFRIKRSLKPSGIFMCSFKEGEIDWIDENGRHFVGMSKSRLSELAKITNLQIVDLQRSKPNSDSLSNFVWLWLCGRKV